MELAHREGILSAASLMMAAPACAEAIEIARRLPSLHVGLHLTLVEALPCLPAEAIPYLVDAEGVLRSDMARFGAEIFFRPQVRRQMRAEIAAQFQAFAATGLKLDHVNAHKHFHLHPSIADIVFDVGQAYGMMALRVPLEPFDIVRQIEPRATNPVRFVMDPWARRLAKRARRRGLSVPDQVFGLAFTGRFTAERLAAILRLLPEGLSEIYCHPASAGGFRFAVPEALYREELAALLSSQARQALQDSGARLGGFSSV